MANEYVMVVIVSGANQRIGTFEFFFIVYVVPSCDRPKSLKLGRYTVYGNLGYSNQRT